MSVDMSSSKGFKSLLTPVGPTIRPAFDMHFDQKFHQLFAPALSSKYIPVAKTTAGKSCENGICSADGATLKMKSTSENHEL